jgi:hypothetical protein
MDSAIARRPVGIAIAAGLWIAMGALMILGAVMGGFAYFMMNVMGPPLPPPSANMPPAFAMMESIFQYFGVLIVLQFILAVIAIWAGVALLRLKPWARATIEILSWLAFLYTVGFGIFWVYLWCSMTGLMPKDDTSINSEMIQIMGMVMGVVITAMFAVPLGIMIRYLRGTEARAAVANAH